MDSQDKALETGIQEEQTLDNVNNDVPELVEETDFDAEEAGQEEAVQPAETVRKVYASKQEVVERTKELAHGEEVPAKDEVDYLKAVFYKLHVAEREAQQKNYLEQGGDPEKYQYVPDEAEAVFKAEMGIIRERRAKLFREQEEEKEANLQKKLAIIEKIKTMVTSPEEANNTYQEFKKLQQEWKDIKSVPATKANEVWRNYQLYVEQFYDLLKLNSEAREYDFKKNLEAKTRLCEAAEKLAEETDLISAFYQLQKLHQEYREIGPVAKELRDEVWNRFKAASTVINKRHQQHFENLRAMEEENLKLKTQLCEKVEAILAEECKGSAGWEAKSKAIIDLQTEWKAIGFAPQKMNVKIFERFRAACDTFFSRKNEFFKEMKETMKANTEKKRELVEKAKALSESKEWKSTADKLIALQKEWKSIGPSPKKTSDLLWAEFQAACNKFFEARKAVGGAQRSEEHANLQKKRDIIARLQALAEDPEADKQEELQKLVEEYNAIGHVPFKEKDKIYEEYRAAQNAVYKQLHANESRRRLDNFKNKVKAAQEHGDGNLGGERNRLVRRYETLKQEIQTYENNLGFLNAGSKKGNSLIDEMKRKVEKLKEDMNLLREQIKAIDAANS